MAASACQAASEKSAKAPKADNCWPSGVRRVSKTTESRQLLTRQHQKSQQKHRKPTTADPTTRQKSAKQQIAETADPTTCQKSAKQQIAETTDPTTRQKSAKQPNAKKADFSALNKSSFLSIAVVYCKRIFKMHTKTPMQSWKALERRVKGEKWK